MMMVLVVRMPLLCHGLPDEEPDRRSVSDRGQARTSQPASSARPRGGGVRVALISQEGDSGGTWVAFPTYEQLGVWADRIGVEMIKGQYNADPAALCYDAYQAAERKGEERRDPALEGHAVLQLMYGVRYVPNVRRT